MRLIHSLGLSSTDIDLTTWTTMRGLDNCLKIISDSNLKKLFPSLILGMRENHETFGISLNIIQLVNGNYPT